MKSLDEKIELLKSEIAALEAEKAVNPGSIGGRIRKEMRNKGDFLCLDGAESWLYAANHIQICPMQKSCPCGDARSDCAGAGCIVRLFDLWGGKRTCH